MAQRAADGQGVIHIWFNNAGVEGGIAELADLDDLTVHQLLDTNIKGVYSGMRYAVKHMRNGGLIINSASFVGTAKPLPSRNTQSCSSPARQRWAGRR